MWPKNIAEIYGSMVVESKVERVSPDSSSGKAWTVGGRHSTPNVPKWVHRRYSIGNVSNSELQKRTVVF